VLRVIDAPCTGFEIETLLHIRAARSGLRVAEVPSFESARIHGSSHLSTFRDGFRVLRVITVEWCARQSGRTRALGERQPPGEEALRLHDVKPRVRQAD
jgi:hypothetical protein